MEEEVVEQGTAAETQGGASEITEQSDGSAKAANGAVEQSAESDVESEADAAADPEVEDLNEDSESVRKQAVQPIECESCKNTFVPEELKLVDVTGQQEIKDELVSGKYFLTECPHCGTKGIHLYPVFVVDSEKKYRILLAFDGNFVSVLHHARVSFVSQELLEQGGEWKERVVLGPRQLEEKFHIFDAGLDDMCVEFAKVMLARRSGNVGILALHFHGIDHDSANFIVPGKREEVALFSVPLDAFKAAYREGEEMLGQFLHGMVRYVSAETVLEDIKVLEKTDPSQIFHRVAKALGLMENEELGDRLKWYTCAQKLARMIVDRIGVPEIKTVSDIRDFFVASFSISFGMGLGASTEWRNNPTGFSADSIFEMMIVPDGIGKVLENAYAKLKTHNEPAEMRVFLCS